MRDFTSWHGPLRRPATHVNLGELVLYRLREHQVLNHIHAELVADALAPTHVLELLLEAPARDAEGEARLVRQWRDVGLRVVLEVPRGRPARGEVVADVVHGPALWGEKQKERARVVTVSRGARRY